MMAKLKGLELCINSNSSISSYYLTLITSIFWDCSVVHNHHSSSLSAAFHIGSDSFSKITLL